MDKLLLTPREAADVLGIGRSKLYELLQAGEISSVRIGKCRRIPTTALLDLVERLSPVRDDLAPAAAARREPTSKPPFHPQSGLVVGTRVQAQEQIA